MIFRWKERKQKMYLIVGLGNPGTKYEKTRHNVGFDTIDVLADRMDIRVNKKEKQALTGSGYINGQKVMLVKPLTYMNLSGSSVRDLVSWYKVDPTLELIVLSDDVSLSPGHIRIRKKGSAGGHNGLKDIIGKLGTDQFIRVRIGVGKKPAEWDMADYVLSRFSDQDRKDVEQAFLDAADAVSLIVADQMEEAMNRFNKKESKKKETLQKEEPAALDQGK